MNSENLEVQLTNYALGELDYEQKREVEKWLAAHPEGRKQVEETRALAELLQTQLRAADKPVLTAQQRQAIATELQAAKPARSQRALWNQFAWAACLILAVGLTFIYMPQTLVTLEDKHKLTVNRPVLEQSQKKDEDVAFSDDAEDGMMPKPEQSFGASGLATNMPSAPKMMQHEGLRLPDPAPVEQPTEAWNTEAYDFLSENPYQAVAQNPLSTFSIDVDTASYANIRRFLNQNTLQPKDAVRVEEMVNYFPYQYASPTGEDPFAADTEVAASPWHEGYRLVRIGIKGKDVALANRPASNLVFLLDVSGSMYDDNKLPLLKEALKLLVAKLDERDRVSIVTYAGNSGVVLPATRGDQKEVILSAIDKLNADGSTNGAAGILTAYDTAVAQFIPKGVNRVILATDGDFNVGTTSQGDLTRLIAEKAKSGVFLSVLGVGMGNYKDATVELLADKGNGNYAYIDSLTEAKKVLVEQMSGTLLTIAKDVKIQVEFNPAQVKAYRLIGYENRLLKKEDFNNDKIDAGEIGAGHTVTALYEVVPVGQTIDLPGVDPLKYQTPQTGKPTTSTELLTVKIRYKQPQGDQSQLLQFPVQDSGKSLVDASPDFKFATAVAGFGLLLRDSPQKGNASYASVLDLAQQGLGEDVQGYRKEFLGLVGKARSLGR